MPSQHMRLLFVVLGLAAVALIVRHRRTQNIWPVLQHGAHTYLALSSAPPVTPLMAAPEPERGCAVPRPGTGALAGYTFATHPWLFTDLDECRNSLFALPFASPLPCDFLPIHLYWRQTLRPWGRLQAISVMSLLATQNLTHTRVYLWTDDGALLNSPFLRPIADRVAVVLYSPVDLAKGTVLEGWAGLHTQDNKAYLDADLFRILVLNRYGGLYVDTDVVALRDFAPLLTHEWAYQWGGWRNRWPKSADHAKRLNNAVMRMRPGSAALAAMMIEIRKMAPPKQGTTEWGRHLYGRVLHRPPPALATPWPVILPMCYVDPEWWGALGFRDLLRADRGRSDLHLEAFAYHFHFSSMVEQGKEEPEHGSRFERFERHVWDRFCARDLSPVCRNTVSH